MKLGTHNSLTSYPLLGWQKHFGWLINLVSRCQTKTIREQLLSGVRWFNLQVSKKDDMWLGSHGIAWYNIRLRDVLKELNEYPEPIYVQLYLDRHFGNKIPLTQFKTLWFECKKYYPNINFQYVWSEQDNEILWREPIDGEEKYWTFAGAKHFWEKLPIPILWHKLFYKERWSTTNKEYLMIDFV